MRVLGDALSCAVRLRLAIVVFICRTVLRMQRRCLVFVSVRSKVIVSAS
jgi:hypothetical protein